MNSDFNFSANAGKPSSTSRLVRVPKKRSSNTSVPIILVGLVFATVIGFVALGSLGAGRLGGRSTKTNVSSLEGEWREVESTRFKPKFLLGQSIQAVSEGGPGEPGWVGDVMVKKSVPTGDASTWYINSSSEPKEIVTVAPDGQEHHSYWLVQTTNNKNGRIRIKIWNKSKGREPPPDSNCSIAIIHLSPSRATLEKIGVFSDWMYKFEWVGPSKSP